ncbi:MFS transporter [Ferroacidibacillus organovorans]|uniref:Major facilitator superfamily (MFS) profile domain-containing protein n=1 Tax=Ferroacidibacillus organovorans TaxID=1765683 RepID=A0A101XS40_9BACL|nr:MFS transporter [Ferroacidibacillus organovorans]KUO96506.1 hypothetical protein ATW55_01220 [Ferroacidibacillus organovorans]
MNGFVQLASWMYLMNGLSNESLGSAFVALLHHYKASYTLGGQLVFLQFFGFLLGVGASSLIVRRIGYRHTLILASLCIAIAQIVTAMLPPMPILVVTCLINGFGLACTQNTIVASLMEWFAGRRAVVMSRMEVAFGAGSLIMPLAVSGFIAWHHWNLGFYLVGIISLVLCLAWMFIPLNAHHDTHVGPRDAHSAVLTVQGAGAKTLLISVFVGMIFLYVGLESCMNNFLPSIFISYIHIRASVATLTVTLFWMAMVIGRALTGRVIRSVPYSRFLLISIGATMVLFALLALIQNPWADIVFVFLLGLGMSGIFVIIMVFANHAFPGQNQRVTTLVTLFAGLGGALMPALFGWLMDHESIRVNLWNLTGFALLLFAMLIVIMRIEANRIPPVASDGPHFSS